MSRWALCVMHLTGTPKLGEGLQAYTVLYIAHAHGSVFLSLNGCVAW